MLFYFLFLWHFKMLSHIVFIQLLFQLCWFLLSVRPRLLLLRRRCWGRRESWKRPVRSWHRSDNSSTSSCQANSEKMRTKHNCWLPRDRVVHHLIFAFRTQMDFSSTYSPVHTTPAKLMKGHLISWLDCEFLNI